MYYGIVLNIGILMGIFAAELDIDSKCSGVGKYDSWFFTDVRCAPITTHTTIDSAKAKVESYQAAVGG